MKHFSSTAFRLAIAALSAAVLLCETPGPARAQSAGDDSSVVASLPPSAADAIKLTRAGLDESVILAQINSSGGSCQLSADQVLYLSNAGVSQNVIKALMSGNAPAATNNAPAGVAQDNSGYAPPAQAPVSGDSPAPAAPAPVSFDSFHDQLAPYGNWVQAGDYGWCWSPSVAVADPAWRPYCDQGQWVYTDQGWFWQSAYSWGDIAFHYGRWYQDASYGWLWVPDYTWAPAWVCWRNAEFAGACGWAPLPPGARFVAGLGLFYNGRLALDVDFGLRWDAFIFVGYDHFWDRNYRLWMFPRERVAFFYSRTLVLNGYRLVGGRFMVDGLGRDRMARFTHRDVRVERARDVRAREERAHVEARRVDARRGEAARAEAHRGDTARPDTRPGARPDVRTDARGADHRPDTYGARAESERGSPGGYGRPGVSNQRPPAQGARPGSAAKPSGSAKPGNNSTQQKKNPQQQR